MPRILEKVERRLGEKLFLKGDRCVGPKCAAVRRAYPPGPQRKGRGRGRGGSEYGELLREKQKVRYFYGLDDREMKRYVEAAARQTGIFGANFMSLLERRLDIVVWRLGLVPSRRTGRQLVGHGHVAVNGRTVSIPSYAVRQGDVVALTGRLGASPALTERLRAIQPPRWLTLDKGQSRGTMVGLPEGEELGLTFDVTKIKEFYSR